MNLTEQVSRAVRKAFEEQYTDLCTVTFYGKITDPETHETYTGEITTGMEYPCRLSFEQGAPTGDGKNASLTQGIKLFLAPEVEIQPGSKLTVIRQGQATEYKNSGKPALYPSHQEVKLELLQEWA